MKDLDSVKKIAVLIDAENTQHTVLPAIMAELSKHGHLICKKAYGDWSSVLLKNWKQQLNELAINPVQQFSYTQGKNSSDAALIIDAMDLLYSGKYDAFALVSSDSDFTKLASRLREAEMYVFGVGEQKTPLAFRNACDDFIFTEVLKNLDQQDEVEKTDEPEQPEAVRRSRKELCCDTRLVQILRNAVSEYANDDGWADLAPCGGLIKRQFPDFDPRTYGYPTLSQLIDATNLFAIDRKLIGNGKGAQILVKDKRG